MATPPDGNGGGDVARAGLLALAATMLLLVGCSGDEHVPAPGDANAVQHLKEDCANPIWKQQNLGLWYSLCRKPVNL
jgi:hypothetical protein